jgi:hypothetical protein
MQRTSCGMPCRKKKISKFGLRPGGHSKTTGTYRIKGQILRYGGDRPWRVLLQITR